MKRETAEHISHYFEWLNERGNGTVAVSRLHAGTPLTDFHQWANNRPLIAADLLSRDDGLSVICLLIDWKETGSWFLVACDSKTHAPLCEISHERGEEPQQQLVWTCKPTKRDNRHPERVAYFVRVMGDREVSLAMPLRYLARSASFAEDILSLAEVRLASDQLKQNAPDRRDAFPEGEMVERLHMGRERTSAVIREAMLRTKKGGPLACKECAFDFHERYGDLGEGFIEAHHTRPLSELSAATGTRVEDLALVCANCHRMLHRKRSWISIDGLKTLLTVDATPEDGRLANRSSR